MAIGLWKEDTGIDELTYKNNVPGKGKTKLDGAFGRMTQHLHRKVDEGESFDSAEELFEIMNKFPLQYTEYHLLDLKRDQVNWTRVLPKEVEDESFGREFYLLTNSNGIIAGNCYSGFGEGRILVCLEPKSKFFDLVVLPLLFIIVNNAPLIFILFYHFRARKESEEGKVIHVH